MKKPSQSPHVSPQTPLASGMGLASTKAADLLVLLQNQTQYIQSLETNLNQLTVENAQLYVKTIFVDGGAMMKRVRPAPQGRAYRVRKRSNHVTLVVDSKIASTVETVNNNTA